MSLGYGDKEYKQNRVQDKSNLPSLEEALKLPVSPIPGRSLSLPELEHFGVRCEQDSNGKIEAYYFIYYENGEPCGYKRKTVPESAADKSQYTVVGKVNNKTGFFGHQKQNKGRRLWICEGEADCVALYAAIMKSQVGTKWENNLIPSVVSIATGAVNAAAHVLENIEYLKQFKEIVLVFDSDSASPAERAKGIKRGREAVEDVCMALPDMNIKCVTLPLKDANAMVMAGRSKELAEFALFQAQPYMPESLSGYRDDDSELDELMAPLKDGIHLSFLPKTSKMLRGFRPHEMTLLLGPSGKGKSAVSKQVAIEILKQDPTAKVASFYLEEDFRKSKQIYIAMLNNVRWSAYRQNTSLLTREQVREARDFLKDRTVFYNCDKSDLLDPTSVERMIRGCAIRGYTHIIFDHLSFVFGGSNENSAQGIEKLLTHLSRIPRGYPIHLFVVAHIKRGTYIPPKDPDTRETIYPHWRPVSVDDAKGCVDGKTEYLSPTGWTPISSYVSGKVCQFDPESRAISFVDPIRYVVQACEYLTEIKTNRLSMAVSDDHRVVYRTEKIDNYVSKPWSEVYAEHKTNSTGFRGLVPTTFKPSGELTTGLSESDLRIQVMLNADGWLAQRKTTTGYALVRLKKARKIERARQLLAGKHFNEYKINDPRGEYTEFAFYAPLMSKGYPDTWYGLGKEEIDIILDELKYWDGELSTGRFSSTNIKETELVQFWYHCSGRRSNWYVHPRGEYLPGYVSQECYYTGPNQKESGYVSFRNCPNGKATFERFRPEDGKQYCFEVPTGMLILRRDNKIFITGNSSGYEQLTWNLLCLEPEVLDSEGNTGRVRLVVRKNREWGDCGVGDILNYNKTSGLLI